MLVTIWDRNLSLLTCFQALKGGFLIALRSLHRILSPICWLHSPALPLQTLSSLSFGTWWIPRTIYLSNHFLMKTFPWLSPTHSKGYTGFSCSHHPSFLFMASQRAHASGFNYNLTWMVLLWTSLVWTTLSSSVLGLRSVYGCTREDVVLPLSSEVLAEIPGTKRWTVHRNTLFYCASLLPFTDTAGFFCFYCSWFFLNWRFVATQPQASLSAPFFQMPLLTSCLCVTVW